MLASASPYSHMAIVERGKEGKLYVVEASVQVHRLPIESFIERGYLKRITVKRVKGLQPAQARQVLDWAMTQAGKPYDLYFIDDDSAFYCSELAYDAFDRALDMRIGTPDKVGTLNLDFAPVKALIRERWRNYPLCKKQGVKTYEVCLDIIKQQQLITLGSMADDEKLETVYTNYWFW
jgi:hypothetical protein